MKICEMNLIEDWYTCPCFNNEYSYSCNLGFNITNESEGKTKLVSYDCKCKKIILEDKEIIIKEE